MDGVVHAHICACVLTLSILMSADGVSFEAVLTPCSCNESEKLESERNCSSFIFFLAILWWILWLAHRVRCYRMGEVYNYKTLLFAASSAAYARDVVSIFPIVIWEHRGCPICWRFVQIWKAESSVWEWEIAFREQEESKKRDKLKSSSWINKPNRKLLSSVREGC